MGDMRRGDGYETQMDFPFTSEFIVITKIKTEIFTLNLPKLRLIIIVSLNNALLCLYSRINKNNVKHPEMHIIYNALRDNWDDWNIVCKDYGNKYCKMMQILEVSPFL